VLGFFYASIGFKDSNEVKSLDVINVLQLFSLCDDFIGVKFIFESNSDIVVNWMNNYSFNRSYKLYELFIYEPRFSSHLGLVFFSHVMCNANHLTDDFAE